MSFFIGIKSSRVCLTLRYWHQAHFVAETELYKTHPVISEKNLGTYLFETDFQTIPKIILIIGMMLMAYGYWNYDKISKALRIYRKMEGRNKRNGRSKEYV